MSNENYAQYRKNIQNGDLLIWSSDKSSLMSRMYLYIIRLFTLSSYAHIGIALWVNGRLCVVEASQPVVKVIPISLANNFYHIKMNLQISSGDISWLMSKVGQKYSMVKAIKSYFKLPLELDSTWQCVQLVSEFYKKYNLIVDDSYIPSQFIDNLLDDYTRSLVKVKVR